MFTGIIEALGQITESHATGGDRRLRIQTGDLPLADVQLGDSIAVNGVCLTVAELLEDGFFADVSVETLQLTTLGALECPAPVNLERSLTPASRMGGHMVSGHVDGVAEVISRHPDGRSERFVLRAPDELARYIARKGSVALDGTSLTINDVRGSEFSINIVPHTLEHTVINDYRPGTRVNIEVDVIARYLERLLQVGSVANN